MGNFSCIPLFRRLTGPALRIIIAVVFLHLPWCSRGQQWPAYTRPDGLSVQFNHNVEFTGLVFFMGSLGEVASAPGAIMPGGIPQKDWFAYQLSLYRQYSSHLNDSNLHIAAGYLERLQPTDLLPLVISCENFPDARLHPGIPYDMIRNYAPASDSLAAAKEATRFLEALNRLYRNMSFQQYLPAAKRYYACALAELQEALPGDRVIPAMEKFYRRSFSGYVLMPSLTIPSGMAFGVHTEQSGLRKVYNVFGPYDTLRTDNGGRHCFGFNKPDHISWLSVHEFGHSFIHAAFYEIPPDLFAASAHLFEPIRAAMEEQGYDSWENCVNEHFVRAGEVIITRELDGSEAAAALQRSYISDRKFTYLPVIIRHLEAYSRDKTARYATAMQQALRSLVKEYEISEK